MTYGEAVTGTVKGLAAQPGFLLIAVLNVIMLGALLYVAKAQGEERKDLALRQDGIVKLLLEHCPRDGERPP